MKNESGKDNKTKTGREFPSFFHFQWVGRDPKSGSGWGRDPPVGETRVADWWVAIPKQDHHGVATPVREREFPQLVGRDPKSGP